MRKVLRFFITLFSICFGVGLVVSKMEKRKGWVEGHKPYGIYEKHFKRPFDFAIALFGLILFWPLLLIIALIVKINLGSPVIFKQDRPGMGGKTIKLLKYRTMSSKKGPDGKLLPDEQRMTPIGSRIRALSLDARVIIRQTTESTVITAFREVSPKPFYWGRDLSSDALINRREYDTLALIA